MYKQLQIVAIYVAILTTMLDASIANLILPNIAADLYIDIRFSSWIVTSFGVGMVVAFALSTLLNDYFTTDGSLLIGCVVFMLSSVGCAYSDHINTLLAYRFIQGISSGLILVVSLVTFYRIIGEEKRAFAQSLWGSAITMAPVVGPVCGAVITEALNWRWLFLVNIPMMTFSVLILLPSFDLRRFKDVHKLNKLWVIIPFVSGVMCFQWVLDFGDIRGWFADPMICYVAAASAISAFIFYVVNQRFVLFDFAVFKDTHYAVFTTILCIGNGLIMTSLVMLPIYLRTDYGMPVLIAGMVVSVASGVSAICSPLVGKFVPPRFFGFCAVLSMLFSAISFYQMSLFGSGTSIESIIVIRIFAGMGIVFFSLPYTVLSLKNLQTEQIVNASSISLMFRTFLANTFIAVAFITSGHMRHLQEIEFISNIDRHTLIKYGGEMPVQASIYLSKTFSNNAVAFVFEVTAWMFFACMLVTAYFVVYLSSKASKNKEKHE